MGSILVLLAGVRYIGLGKFVKSQQITTLFGVGISIASGVLYLSYETPPYYLRPSNIFHLHYVVIPQQLTFITSLLTRGEILIRSWLLFSLLFLSLVSSRIYFYFECEVYMYSDGCYRMSAYLHFFICIVVACVSFFRSTVDRLSYLSAIWCKFNNF